MKNKKIKKIITASLISFFLLQLFYGISEPSIVTAATQTDQVVVTLNVDPGITITAPADVVLPALGTGINTSIGSAAWTVKTNNTIGYKLDVKAGASPALVNGGFSFADYTEGAVGTPEAWSVAVGAKEFGYSARGADVPAAWGTGSDCGTGILPNATLKYVGFKTTDKTVATKASPTPYIGELTTVCFAVEQDGVFAQSGTYTATITATATTL